VSQSAEHLRSGQLGTADVTASTVANIGPGIDFYFAFGVIAVTAGAAAPLTILAAGVAVVLLAFTVAEFTKAEPSAGSFITYVDTALGARAGVATALLVTVGYIVAMAGVFTMSGGMVAMTLSHYTSWHPAWGPLTLVLTVGAIWLTARGLKLSTAAVGAAVLVQVAIMVVVCVIALVEQRAHLSGIPFSRAHLTGGLAGLSAGFPLALYMFIGWENGPALAEESRDPRRTVPRALYISVAIGAPCSSSSPMRPSPLSTTTYRPSGAHLSCSSRWPTIISAERPSWPGSPGSSPCSPPWSPPQTPKRACSSTAAGPGCCRPSLVTFARGPARR
jgi:amino acid transporter